MDVKKCFLAGLPRAGKSTYLGALWYVVMHKADLKLVCATTPEDSKYLDELRNMWIRQKRMDRSPFDMPDNIHLEMERTKDGSKLSLTVPDFKGETIQNIINNKISDDLKKWCSENTNLLYLINDLGDVTLKEEIDLKKESELKEASATYPPLTADRMFIQTQHLLVMKYFQTHMSIKKIAIGLSSWDEIGNSQTPDNYLKSKAPALYNFIRFHFPEAYIFGLSAQGAQYKSSDETFQDELQEKTESCERAFIYNGTQSFDITEPFDYLLS